jgi:hypothetical protein
MQDPCQNLIWYEVGIIGTIGWSIVITRTYFATKSTNKPIWPKLIRRVHSQARSHLKPPSATTNPWLLLEKGGPRNPRPWGELGGSWRQLDEAREFNTVMSSPAFLVYLLVVKTCSLCDGYHLDPSEPMRIWYFMIGVWNFILLPGVSVSQNNKTLSKLSYRNSISRTSKNKNENNHRWWISIIILVWPTRDRYLIPSTLSNNFPFDKRRQLRQIITVLNQRIALNGAHRRIPK